MFFVDEVAKLPTVSAARGCVERFQSDGVVTLWLLRPRILEIYRPESGNVNRDYSARDSVRDSVRASLRLRFTVRARVCSQSSETNGAPKRAVTRVQRVYTRLSRCETISVS